MWFNYFFLLEGKQQGAIDLETQKKKAGGGRTINTRLDCCIPIVSARQ